MKALNIIFFAATCILAADSSDDEPFTETSFTEAQVNKVNEDGTISLEINPGSYIKMEKSAISMEMTNQVNKPVTAEVAKK